MSQEILIGLQEFGLTGLQARTYVALLQLGRCRASQVSAMLGVPRPEAYGVLRELSFKGLVQQTPGSPTTYFGVPPDEALSRLLGKFTQKVQGLQVRKNELSKALAPYEHIGDGLTLERFDLIAGGGNAFNKELQMVKRVQQEYAAIYSKPGLRRLGEGNTQFTDFAEVLKAAKRRGVRVRIISEVDKTNKSGVDFLLSYHFEFRRLKGLLFYMAIFDRREMLIGPPLLDEETNWRDSRQADIWTNNPRFIRGMYTLFEKLWANSKNVS